MTHLYGRGFEVIAKTLRGHNLCAYVAPCNSLKSTIERLQDDDPIWQKPRIRIMRQERIPLYRDVLRYMDLPAMIVEKRTLD